MPRILPAISDLFSDSGRGGCIVSDYSDEEIRSFSGREEIGEGAVPFMYEPVEQSIPRSGSATTIPPVFIPENVNAPAPPSYAEMSGMWNVSSMVNDLNGIICANTRIKPTYADCWLMGRRDSLEMISEYDTPSGRVMIGRASDGETEYNLTPNEYTYPDSMNAVISNVISRVRETYRKKGGRMDRQSVLGSARGILMDSADTLEAVRGNDSRDIEKTVEDVCDIVYRYTIGLGIFDILLSDPKLEDIYIDAPCDRNRIHVTMNGVSGVNSHLRCRTNLIVDRKEVLNLINVLKRDSGLPFCESNPILETDMKFHDSRATVVGYPMSPNGDAVAIRKHSIRPWTLTRLIANGTIDSRVAGLLSFLVDNRATFLVCGARGAGKSSLLSALMFEFPVSQRILTIEDTMELPGEKMRRMGYKVQSMLIDDRMNGSDLSRADEALRVSLRMGESAIVLGEVRGEEARTLYQSMRTGRAGSSIMGTIHGDSAKSVYERVVHDMGIAPEAFMATDILVTLGTVRDKRSGNQIRRLNEIMATEEAAGEFVDISDTNGLFSSPVMRRVMITSQMNKPEILKEIRARAAIRAYLANISKDRGDEFLGPEWIMMANDHVAKSNFKTAEEVLESFKVKVENINGRCGI